MILHKHHIIPKHAGGTNDSSNIVRLPVAEHAEAHRLLYEQYGRIQDKIAWLGLSGRTAEQEAAWSEYLRRPKTEATKQKLREAALGKKASEETKRKMRIAHLGNKSSLGHIQTEEHKLKNALAQRGNNHALGKHHTLSRETRQRMSEAAKRREAAKRLTGSCPTG
jgi:hypothetical protein